MDGPICVYCVWYTVLILCDPIYIFKTIWMHNQEGNGIKDAALIYNITKRMIFLQQNNLFDVNFHVRHYLAGSIAFIM